jgi:nicotinate phosphoribosyltransferase
LKIFLSNQLDELEIWQIIEQIKKEFPHHGLDADNLVGRPAYGAGTRMIVSEGKPALDGVYKLTAVKDENKWLPAIKVSEDQEKRINPGLKNVWRLYDERGKVTADLLALIDEDIEKQQNSILHHPTDSSVKLTVGGEKLSHIKPLLVDITKEGTVGYTFPSLEQIRQNRDDDLDKLDSVANRLINPHIYYVSLTEKLWNLKLEQIQSWKSKYLE